MFKSRKKSAILCAGLFVVLGMWMILSVHCWAAETNQDGTQTKEQKIIRIGSFEDTFNYVDQNGEIDVMGDISYTDERAEKMLFSDEPMGEEKYILYTDLSNIDIGMSDLKSLDGKRVGVLMGTEPEIMLAEWENKNGIQTFAG